MKLKTILAAALSMSSLMVSAQQDWTEARKEIHQNIRLSASNFLAYVDPTEDLTPAPKGYEAFYLTHYGRHGSRWLIGEWEYTDAMKVLSDAHDKRVLTE